MPKSGVMIATVIINLLVIEYNIIVAFNRNYVKFIDKKFFCDYNKVNLQPKEIMLDPNTGDYKSEEEEAFAAWLNDLNVRFWYEPTSLTVLPAAPQHSLRALTYTPDFLVEATTWRQKRKLEQCLKKASKPYVKREFFVSVGNGDAFDEDADYYMVEVKGTNLSSPSVRLFSVIQKTLAYTTDEYVNRVIPQKFFKKWGIPSWSTLTHSTKGIRKCFRTVCATK